MDQYVKISPYHHPSPPNIYKSQRFPTSLKYGVDFISFALRQIQGGLLAEQAHGEDFILPSDGCSLGGFMALAGEMTALISLPSWWSPVSLVATIMSLPFENALLMSSTTDGNGTKIASVGWNRPCPFYGMHGELTMSAGLSVCSPIILLIPPDLCKLCQELFTL